MPALAQHFAERAGGGALPADTVRALSKQTWKGNARELRNAIEAYLAIGEFPPAGRDVDLTRAALQRAVDLDRPFLEQREEFADRFTELYLRALLREVDGNQSEAARRSGLERSYLRKLLANQASGTTMRAADRAAARGTVRALEDVVTLPSTRARAVLCCGLAFLFSSASCKPILGLDVEFDDPAAGGAAATTSTSASAPGTSQSGSAATGPASTSTSPSSSASSSTAGGGGDGGAGGSGGGGNGGNGGNGAAGPGGSGGCPDPGPTSDEFDNGPLDGKWTALVGNEPYTDALPPYHINSNRLRFGSEVSSQWYGDGEGGPFLFQPVNGDFFAWTRGRATMPNGAAPPTDATHGIGLLLREPKDPPGATETFVMVAVGTGVDGQCRIGSSVADNGEPAGTFKELEAGATCEGDLAICRRGGDTRIFGRDGVGDPWEELVPTLDPDSAFSDDLQVGPAVFNYQGSEDTLGTFEFVRFESTCGRSCQEILDAIEAR